ncbi:hypothetical protein ACOSQ4_010954 [Xanthoceras sorbifolium]
MVIRNDAGQVMAATSLRLTANFSPLVAEAAAVLHGLRLAKDIGVASLLIESDAKGVIHAINLGLAPCSDVGLVISDIFVLARELNVLSFSFVPRIANRVADFLANAAYSFAFDLVWIEPCPPDVVLLVQDDFPV